MNQSSTRFRAHGVLRRNVRLDLTVGLNWKQRTGMRRPISPQPCRWTSWLRICSSVMPGNGSHGWEAGDSIKSGGEDLVEGGVQQMFGGGLGGGEAGFQRVTPAQQLVHLRHDPLLFGQRGKCDWQH